MLGGHEVAAQPLERGGLARLAVGAEVIDARVEALAHELGPEAVHDRPREPRVGVGRDGVGHGPASLQVRGAERHARAREKEGRPHHGARLRRVVLVGHRVLELAAAGVVGLLALGPLRRDVVRHHLEPIDARGRLAIDRDPRKESREVVELLPLPAVGEVVVALGALDLDAEEHPRHLRGDVGRLPHLRHDDRRLAMFGRHARGRDHRAGDAVPRGAVAEPGGQKRLERLRDEQRPLVGSAVEDHVTEVAGPGRGPGGIREQPFHRRRPLSRRAVGGELLDLAGGRLAARKIERDPSQERGVVAPGGLVDRCGTGRHRAESGQYPPGEEARQGEPVADERPERAAGQDPQEPADRGVAHDGRGERAGHGGGGIGRCAEDLAPLLPGLEQAGRAHRGQREQERQPGRRSSIEAAEHARGDRDAAPRRARHEGEHLREPHEDAVGKPHALEAVAAGRAAPAPPRRHDLGEGHEGRGAEQGHRDDLQPPGLAADEVPRGEPHDDDRHRAHGDHDREASVGVGERPARAEPRREARQQPADVAPQGDEHRRERAALDDRREGGPGVGPAEQRRHDPQVRGAGDRQELREALHHPQHDRLDDGHRPAMYRTVGRASARGL